MPRYHFDVADSINLPDRDGTELPDTEAARAHAIALLGGLLSDPSQAFWNRPWRLNVTDELGADLLHLSFHAEAVARDDPDGADAPAAGGASTPLQPDPSIR